MKNVTAVVCSWNAIQSIEKCLQSLLDNNVKVIVVDANSNDGSKEVAIKYAYKVITDPREGLGAARNLGIENVTTKYVLNWGVDNILPKRQLEVMLDCLEKNNFGGVSAQTFIMSKKMNYLSKSLNLYKKARFYPGEKNVIGTPTLFETSLLKNNRYDNKMTWSDDGDICTRLAKKNYKFAISPAFVYEYGYESFSTIFTRWKNYGRSDWEIFSKYSIDWSLKRRIQSILYPLYNELFIPLNKASFFDKIKLLPFLIFITLVRYIFWIKFSLFKNKYGS
jgi:glycosyltransferase involved in cell wall biosynthesis